MKIVLAHGVFDLLHFGHIEHLRKARLFGDYLVVSVVADKFIFKGNMIFRQKTIYSQDERLGLLRALRCVDEVILCNAPGPEQIIKELRPAVYVRGADYVDKEMPESELLKRLGIPTKYTTSCPPRTSEIITRVLTGGYFVDVQEQPGESE